MKHLTPEKQLKFQIADFMKLQYPKIPFRIDYDQFKLPVHIQAQILRLRSNLSWPDMEIKYPNKSFSGLFVEIKASKDLIYTKGGNFRNNKHLQEQIASMKFLSGFGYCTCFAWSLDNFQEILISYLN